jgi:arginine-tRNA-protein transferase
MSLLDTHLVNTDHCGYNPRLTRRQKILLPKNKIPRDVFARVAAIANDNGLFTDSAAQQVQSLRCEFCRACVPIRINISKVEISRSEGRTNKRGNALFSSSGLITSPTNSPKYKPVIKEYGDLMTNYLFRRHHTISSRQESAQRIKKSTHALEVRRQNDRQLVGLALMSIGDGRIMLDKIYYNIDDSQHVSLGRYVLLKVIESASENGLSFIYPAPWVKDSHTMDYKKTFPGLETYSFGKWVDFSPENHTNGLSKNQNRKSERIILKELDAQGL